MVAKQEIRNTWFYRLYRGTLLGQIVQFLFHFFKNRLLTDSFKAKSSYKHAFGKYPDLRNPKTLNEKIVWLKLNDRTPLHTICADKYRVRSFVSQQIGEEYLIPLLMDTDKVSDLSPEKLPAEPFVIKTNHNSGGVVLVRNKDNADWKSIRSFFKKKLRENYYHISGEWQYKNIKPRIIIEQLLVDKNEKVPMDYKFHCFNGKVHMIQVDIDRYSNHKRNWYNRFWEREPYKWTSKKPDGSETDPSDSDVPMPENLNHMIRLSEILSEPFDYVRVDWYDLIEQIYFGEITFHHNSGNRPIIPEEWDYRLGQKLILTKLNQ